MYSAFFFKFLAAIDKKVKIIVTVMLVPDTLFELITIIFLTVYFAEQYRRIGTITSTLPISRFIL